MTKLNGFDNTEWVRGPPPEGPFWDRFMKAIYNPEEKSFLGRTAKRWGITLTFYIVFYAVLAAIFAVCMGALLLTLDDKRPSYVLDRSLIGTNPGVTLRPAEELHYDVTNEDDYMKYVHEIQTFLAPYDKQPNASCSYVDDYGFPNSPCFFIKLNKIFDWYPDCYDGTQTPLPDDMEEDLKDYITSQSPEQRSQVWISCRPEHNDTVDIEYPWGRGISAENFPFQNQKGYISQVVAVKLTPLDDVVTTVRCRAWAKNIVYNKSLKEPSGYVLITLNLIGNSTKEAID